MFLIHPVLQGCAILLSLYVAALGIQRFLALHLKQKRRFLWKRHVTLGLITMVVWLAGIVGGVSAVRFFWHGFLLTGQHGITGLILIPFIIFGIISGLYMNRKKRKRLALPLLHGINNIFVILLTLSQIYTGLGVYSAFVLGN